MRHPPAVAAALAAALTLACAEVTPAPNTPPVVTIVTPTDGSRFSGGDDVAIEITAVDQEDGTLGAARITWWSELHHADHTHPFVPETSGASAIVSIPRVGHVETNVFYRIHARAVDSEGAADTASVDIDPRVVTITLETAPSGLEVTVDGQPQRAPFGMSSVVGMERAVGATTPQASGDTDYAFSAWSHGGASTHTYIVPDSDGTLTATFTIIGAANVPPTVTITAPSEGATVRDGTPVALAADAADTDGMVIEVEFLVGTTVVGSDGTAPYEHVWTPSGTGTRTLTARATDDDGAVTVSTAVSVTVEASGGGDVTAPVTTLTAPTHGATGLTGSLTLAANATDDVGVTQVEFQVDGSTIGTDTSAPYEVTLPATSAYTTGAHTARARAGDAAGNWSPWSAATITFGGNVNLPAGFSRSTYASGFNGRITAAAFAPDGRLFVLEQNGSARVVSNAGNLLSTPFVTLSVRDEGERGLLGIAFDPDFVANNYVYLYYTTDEGGTLRNRISRFTAAGDVAAPGETVLIELDPLSNATNHNGGALAFGIDGKLYVAVGDNANSAFAQNLGSRHGKILRYNADGTIPSDNPLLGSTSGGNRAIWALGLRNPFTFAIQPGTGRIHINDVGQNTWEEINLGRPGANYGWPATEGPTTNPAYDPPILAYRHSNSPTLYTGIAILGAGFYSPAINLFGAEYEGDYFFADYGAQWVYRLDSDNWDTAYAFARMDAGIMNMIVGPDGAVYVLLFSSVVRIAR